MPISSEIERIKSAKSDIITAIENKGVTVPTGAKIDELPELIDSIPSGGGNVGLWENISVNASGNDGLVEAKVNRATNEIQISVYGRRYGFSGNDNTQLIVLPNSVQFDGLNMGICWINTNYGQYTANDLGIVKNCAINFAISNNTLYGVFNKAGVYYSLSFRGIVKFV